MPLFLAGRTPPHPRPFLVGSNSGLTVSLQIYWLPENLAETFDVQATRSLLHSEDHHRTAWNQAQQQRPREDLAVLSEATLEMGVGEASRTNSTAVVLSENESSGGGGGRLCPLHGSEIKSQFTDRVDYVTRTSVPLGFISATRR